MRSRRPSVRTASGRVAPQRNRSQAAGVRGPRTIERWPPSGRSAVLVVDFGAQYAQLIARRVRELNVYSEIVPHRITAAEIAAEPPAAIILSGGPKSVHVDGAPIARPGDLRPRHPHPRHLLRRAADRPAARRRRRPGHARRVRPRRADRHRRPTSTLLHDGSPAEQDVWMSHFDAVTEPPPGFVATASTPDAPVAVLEDPQRRIWGVQYHPEVVHTPHGMAVLRRFVIDLAGCAADVDDGLDHRRAGRRGPRPGRRRPGDLRAQRRRRLGGRRCARPPGDRSPADVHLRRHRA